VTTGVVLARTGSAYRVHTAGGEVTAVLRGKLKHRDDDRVVAGDVVDLELQGEGRATISGVRPRRSVLARRAAGERSPRAQPIAANVDQVVVVASARSPELSLRMLDRFLVIAAANRIPAVVVLNKVDLDGGAAYEQARRRYDPAGYQVLATSVPGLAGLAALRDLLRGRESVLAGQSGVGKSSLLNALEPGLDLRIGEISRKWDTGKHTTRAALLVPVAGGYVVDTPGMREVGTWGIDPELLAVCFPEFRPFLDQCRFDNCRHLAEPGCAVREAAARGAFESDRLTSYQRIYEEISVPSWSSGRRRVR
jgi:ribosome biogenesis GTPase